MKGVRLQVRSATSRGRCGQFSSRLLAGDYRSEVFPGPVIDWERDPGTDFLGGKAARVLVQGIIARELFHRNPPSRGPPCGGGGDHPMSVPSTGIRDSVGVSMAHQVTKSARA